MKDVVVVVVLDLFIRRRGQRNTWCSAATGLKVGGWVRHVVVVMVVLDLFIRRRGQRNTWCSAGVGCGRLGATCGGAGFVCPTEGFEEHVVFCSAVAVHLYGR